MPALSLGMYAVYNILHTLRQNVLRTLSLSYNLWLFEDSCIYQTPWQSLSPSSHGPNLKLRMCGEMTYKIRPATVFSLKLLDWVMQWEVWTTCSVLVSSSQMHLWCYWVVLSWWKCYACYACLLHHESHGSQIQSQIQTCKRHTLQSQHCYLCNRNTSPWFSPALHVSDLLNSQGCFELLITHFLYPFRWWAALPIQ